MMRQIPDMMFTTHQWLSPVLRRDAKSLMASAINSAVLVFDVAHGICEPIMLTPFTAMSVTALSTPPDILVTLPTVAAPSTCTATAKPLTESPRSPR